MPTEPSAYLRRQPQQLVDRIQYLPLVDGVATPSATRRIEEGVDDAEEYRDDEEERDEQEEDADDDAQRGRSVPTERDEKGKIRNTSSKKG